MPDRPPTSLTGNQVREVHQIAELEVRRYFDHYLDKVLPKQLESIERQIKSEVQQHDESNAAHRSVEMRLNKMVWVMLGVAMAGGVGGVTASKALAALAGM